MVAGLFAADYMHSFLSYFLRENHRFLLTCSVGERYHKLQKRIYWCSGLQASEARQCHVSRDCDRKNSFRGHVEYVLSAHQSLWQCLCQSLGTVMRYSSLERSQLGLSGWRELAGSGWDQWAGNCISSNCDSMLQQLWISLQFDRKVITVL